VPGTVFYATCAAGLAGILEREVAGLGLAVLERTAGGVFFEGSSLADLYRANLRLRTASRVQRILFRGEAEPDPAVAAIPWAEFLRPERGVEIEVIDAAESIERQRDLAARLRRVVAERLASRAALREDDPHAARVVVHRHRGRTTIGLDASGKALHKRGYRSETAHVSPLQSTLAAALLLHAGYDGSEPFLDPFCGSGTIAIEAATIAVRKVPLIHRKKGDFGFEWHRGFDNAIFRREQEAARRERLAAPPSPVLASDADERAIAGAVKCAERARVGHHIGFSIARFEDLSPKYERGLLVANLPYGERLSRDADLHRRIGHALRERFRGWRVRLLVPDTPEAAALGFDPKHALRVRNGAIECVVLASPIA